MKLLHEFTAVIDVPVELARDLIANPAKALPLRDSGYVLEPAGPGRFTARSPQHSMTVEAEPERGFFAVQGGWWYRSEYLVDPAPGGTRLTQRIYNAASPRSRWAVPLANRFFAGFQAQSRQAFNQLVAELGRVR